MADEANPRPRGAVTRWLERAPQPVFAAFALVAAFVTYFCMYAFRKPFAVGTFSGALVLPLVGPLELKTLFILSQVAGYSTSKFIGVKVVSELTPARRALAIVACIGVAEAGLVLFAVIPGPAGAIGMLINGLPLGMIWGLVFGYIEGRSISDLLGAGLCASFILASGFVKNVGKNVMDWGISERWMPAFTGVLFFPTLVLAVAMLAQLPPPSAEDERLRTRRAPMDAAARRSFFLAYAPGIVALVLGYVLLTALRDLSENYARELWDALGYADAPSILTTTQIPVTAGALAGVAAMMVIRDNRRALLATHGLIIGGAIVAGISTELFRASAIGPVAWMILVGLGLYLSYVPFNCVLFDRLIAATGSVGTAGFLIYVADAFGYLGSTALQIFKNFSQPHVAWVTFFESTTTLSAMACAVLFTASALYFKRRRPESRPSVDSAVANA